MASATGGWEAAIAVTPSTPARIAAAKAKGATRRTTSRVHDPGTPLLGKTPVPSPPLARLNVRRGQSLRTDRRGSAALTARFEPRFQAGNLFKASTVTSSAGA